MLHPILKQDTFFIDDLHLSQLLLMNDARFVWLILVPKRLEILELYDLNKTDQMLLLSEITEISKALKADFSADKINIASIGNQVPQFHVHIVARYKTESAWPAAVWGCGEREVYLPEKAENLTQKMREMVSKIVWFS